MQNTYRRYAILYQRAVVVVGIMVLMLAYTQKTPFLASLYENPVCLLLMTAAVLMYPLMISGIRSTRQWRLRLYAGIQVALIVIVFLWAIFPNIVMRNNGHHLHVLDHVSGPATMQSLAIVLTIGLMTVLPVLVYLLNVFRRR